VGVVGFCFEVGLPMMAVKVPTISSSALLWRTALLKKEQITTPLLLHYAGLDSRVNEGWPAYEAILRKNNIENTAFIYPGVNHGFHNNTTPRYDEAAATVSWSRTIDFFKEQLNKK
jgi:carboxymethylenebutenolidase